MPTKLHYLRRCRHCRWKLEKDVETTHRREFFQLEVVVRQFLQVLRNTALTNASSLTACKTCTCSFCGEPSAPGRPAFTRALAALLVLRRSTILCFAALALASLNCAVAQTFDCSPCVGNTTASICCQCCVGGVLQPGLCNSEQYAGCLPPPTPSYTPTRTATPVSTSSLSFSPIPTSMPILDLSATTTLVFNVSCNFFYWQVPDTVTNITVRAWGAGGFSTQMPPKGGSGAYVEGVAYVTPGETLTVNVGASNSDASGTACGAPGTCPASVGGGFSSIARTLVPSGALAYLLVAGGGGGVGAGDSAGGQGLGISSSGCGTAQFVGGSYTGGTNCGGGGGGWIGGAAASGSAGGGGTSCAPGCISNTVLSLNGPSGFAPFQNSPFYVPGTGGPNEPGCVVISWDGPSPSPSSSAAATASPSLSLSISATASPSPSLSAGATASITASSTVSPYCNPSVFQTFPTNDLVGTPVGIVSFQPTPYGCQLACCSMPGCDGFSFNAEQILLGGSTAPCYLLANVTQLIPSHTYTSGIRASVFSA